ncbi:response regulator transcription factor [Streptomyces coelicoflavus]|uniref:response regulator transcription factor n=1 Tax=Streptomyces coelicoflavus TaxID=285562 RepID=UPI00364C154B
MAAEPLNRRVLAQLRQGIERNPQAPAACTVRMLLEEIDRLNGRSPLELPAPADDCPLTRRQLQVLLGTANGQECPEIGRHLNLSPKTVRKYRVIAMQHLGVRTAAQAVAVCLMRGWFPSGTVHLPEMEQRISPVEARNTYRERAELLRESPGEWGTVAIYDRSATARQSAHRLRTGAFKAFRPEGAWEAKAFSQEGAHSVQARYVGTATVSGSPR